VDFGDGSATQLLNHPPPASICHTYNGSSCASGGGAYTFTITANNNCDISVATITPVRVYAAPVAGFTATPVPACVNSAITFNNISVLGYNNQCSTTTLFTWAWGDGSPNTVVTTNAAQSHSYSVAGNYTVTLSAQNSCGTTTDSQVICVETPPTPIFTVNANTGCVPMAVTTDNTSNNGIPCAVNYTWLVDYVDLPCDPDNGLYSFTNSTSSSSLEPQFLLSSVGTYTLRLRMTNACGVFEDTELVTVNTVPVVAVNAISSVCSGTSVSPSAIVDPCNLPITSYAWAFPNGTPASSTTLSPGPVTYPTA
jgi:PKD repeat protein